MMSLCAKFVDYLNELYYDGKMMLGRDRLYKYVQQHRPDLVKQGLSRRKVMSYLKAQEVHQRFWPIRSTPYIQSTVPSEPFAIVAMDLIDMNSMAVHGYKWALTAIDLFSKRAYAVPLKSKDAIDVVKGFGLLLYGNMETLRICKHGSSDMSKWTIHRHTVKPCKTIAPQMTLHPRHLRSDNGSEFKNALFTTFLNNHTKPVRDAPNGSINGPNGSITTSNGSITTSNGSINAPNGSTSNGSTTSGSNGSITTTTTGGTGSTTSGSNGSPNGSTTTQHFSLPHKPQSNGCIERFNKFLKRQIKMISLQHDDNDWVVTIPTILENHNKTWHRITKKTPNEVEEQYLKTHCVANIRNTMIKAVSKRNAKLNTLEEAKFKVGDLVRVKLSWSKSAGLNWSRQIYKVKRVIVQKQIPLFRHVQYKLVACDVDDDVDVDVNKNSNVNKNKNSKGKNSNVNGNNTITNKFICDEAVSGVFYNDQLQLYVHVMRQVKGPERFVIHRLLKPVLRKRNNVKVRMYEVSWAGYRERTEEPRSTLLLDVPHLVMRFEAKHKVEWSSSDKGPSWEK